MPPAYKWGGAPAGAGLPSARERAAWQAGYDLADNLTAAGLAEHLAELCPAVPLGEDGERARAELPPGVWAYAFLAGMARAVADGLR